MRAGEAERTYSPRADVTIVRDRGYGVPHVYGSTRAGAMFGLGYVAAEDRLFFIDVLRNLGRARLSSFVGGAPGNRELDHEQWLLAPYTEEDLQAQVDQLDDLYGAAGGADPGRRHGLRRRGQPVHRRGEGRPAPRCPASTRRSAARSGPRRGRRPT